MSDLRNNPFSGLFSSVQEAESFSEERPSTVGSTALEALQGLPSLLLTSLANDKENDQCNLFQQSHDKEIINELVEEDEESVKRSAQMKEQINRQIEHIFLITFDRTATPVGRPSHCVYLEDLHGALHRQDVLDTDCLEAAVFERLMLSEPHSYVVQTDSASKQDSTQEAEEARRTYYLFQSYCRINRQDKHQSDVVAKCELTVYRNMQMALVHSHIYPDVNIYEEFTNLLSEYYDDPNISDFVNGVVETVEIARENEGGPTVFATFKNVFDVLSTKFRNTIITDPRLFSYIRCLQLLTAKASVAHAFIKESTPKSGEDPMSYANTLLGRILSISSLPLSAQGPFEFFNNPARLTQYEQETTERSLWTPLKQLSTEVHRLILSMLRLPNPEIKNAICTWIGSCLQANNGRAKLWHHLTGTLMYNFVSDGFMLNLCSVLLRICEPITVIGSTKLLLVDPTYCAVDILSDSDANSMGIHMGGMNEETCLLSSSNDRPHKDSYNFITECFYMTHKSLQIGFHSLHERMTKLITEIRRLQRTYNEAVQQGGETSDAAETIKRSMEQGTTTYFSAKAHMVEPESLKMMLQFYTATAKWLVNLAVDDDHTVFHRYELPLPPNSPDCFRCIPEFIIDNITDFTTFLRRFAPRYFEVDAGDHFLVKLLNLILVFMGSPEKTKNPHLRAKLAEALENVMPHPDESNPHLDDSIVFAREQVFRGHPHSNLIVPVLMHVFVSIEMTGQSVAFEQKFNYRRPMYEVLEYVWKIDIHREAFRILADESENNIKNPDAPLFLRFINLLMNDANYLLDEGLMHVSKLKDHQHRRETEEFRQLPVQQRQEAEAAYRHTGLLARFHNIMGRQTIKTLEMLTSETKSIFLHPINVERIANMLNYFLLHLVGPKRKQLALQDKEEFDFKPHDLVAGICHIYVHLGKEDSEGGHTRFLKAVASDGRSYSPDLLVKAETVLCRIGHGAISPDFQEVATKVKVIADQLKIEEECLENVPEEFLDAILGTVMTDPVVLPSSMVVVDRSTIARHLLSDQSDPFNRSPLTMDMVKPDEALKERINKWRRENELMQTSSH